MATLTIIWQCLWGLPQTLAGGLVYLVLRHWTQAAPAAPDRRGTVVTYWPFESGVSLGLFVFVPQDVGEKFIRHECGHSRQSLLLGPLYLLVIGLPSLIWAGLPALERRRERKGTSYYAFYTERWADRWGGVERTRPPCAGRADSL